MERSNAAIIGMTGCGKTSASEIAAELTGFAFFDTDRLLEAKYQMKIADIYQRLGENAFRNAEADLLDAFFSLPEGRKNVILACGGGIVVNPRSMEILKKNCTVIRLVRSPEEIASDPEILKRPPICGNRQRLFEIFAARQPLYEKYADFTVSGSSAAAAAERIAGILTYQPIDDLMNQKRNTTWQK